MYKKSSSKRKLDLSSTLQLDQHLDCNIFLACLSLSPLTSTKSQERRIYYYFFLSSTLLRPSQTLLGPCVRNTFPKKLEFAKKKYQKGLGGRGGYVHTEKFKYRHRGLRIILVVGKYEMGSSTSKRIDDENADVVEEILLSTPQREGKDSIRTFSLAELSGHIPYNQSL